MFHREYCHTIGSISESAYIVPQDKPVKIVKVLFSDRKPVNAVVVVDKAKPVGLVMNIHMNDKLSQQYGFSLFMNKAISTIMDDSPLMVNHDELIEDVSEKAMNRDRRRLYDHIIVLKKGLLMGIVAVRTILKHLVKSQRERTNILERYTARLEQEDMEKKRAIQGLEDSKKMLQLVIDSIPHAIFWKDRNSVYLGCNKKFARDAGVARTADIKGLTDDQLSWTKKEATLFVKQDQQLMNSDCSQMNIHQIQTNIKGEKRFLDTHKKVLRDSDQKVVGVLCFYQDITRRLQADNDHLKLEKNLAQARKMEAIGRLAGGVAHDLNNILSAIINYPELIMMDFPENDRLFEPLKIIKESGERAAAIVQDLLTLARRGVVKKEMVDLNRIVCQCLGSPECIKLKEDFPLVEIKNETAPQLMPIEGSSVHLMKAIMNLLNNSAEAIVGPGLITIKTWNETIDKSFLNDTPPCCERVVGLSVSDNGEGIQKVDIEKIFEPFYTKKKMGRSGTGLGMAVVWGTVEDLNGTIDISSRPGRGTTVTIRIPAKKQGVKPVPDDLSHENIMGEGQTILVIDDMPDQRDIANRYLEKMNYQVHTMQSGEQALEFLKNQHVDLLILDMIMEPGMDGLETYMKILEIHPGQPAIITSGFSESDRVKEAQRLGAGPYIKKPYDFRSLGRAVKRELQGLSETVSDKR
jgi:two-component system cell cycle sensor histidine kinase/response regulator CckA